MAPTWEQSKNPCTYTHTREFHSAMRVKETLPFVTPLDGPSGHYAGEISQTKANATCYHLMWTLKKSPSKRNRKVVAWDGGMGE